MNNFEDFDKNDKKDIVIYKDSLGNYEKLEYQYDILILTRSDIQKYDYKDKIIYSKKKG